jgi:hypothetical protein
MAATRRGRLDALGGGRVSVRAHHGAVEHEVRPALPGHLPQCLVRVGGLGGEHREGLVAVAVGRRAWHPEPGTDDLDVRFGAEPHQHQQGLLEAGQQACPLPSAAGAALDAQQVGRLPDQFTGDVEHGRIGDHVGSR